MIHAAANQELYVLDTPENDVDNIIYTIREVKCVYESFCGLVYNNSPQKMSRWPWDFFF